jgi:hypothetical protein
MGEIEHWISCPDAAVCQRCPCADEDDVCFPGERMGAELAAAREQLRGAVSAAEQGVDVLDELTVYWKVGDLPPEVQDRFDAARSALAAVGGQ